MITVTFNGAVNKALAETGAPTSTNNGTSATASDTPWVIEAGDIRSRAGETIDLNSDLIVRGKLILNSVIINVHSSPTKIISIIVEDSGELNIDQSTLQAASLNPPYYFDFIVYGKLEMTNSKIIGLNGDPANPKGGIQIFSDNVDIEKTAISKALSSAIYLYRSGAKINNVEIDGAKYGIYVDSNRLITTPDLAVYSSDISFTPPCPEAGETVQIIAMIHNLGDRNAESSVRFYDGDPHHGGSKLGPDQIILIEGGQTVPVTYSWTAVAGSHNIFVSVDEDQTVREADFANNIASKSIRPFFKVHVQKDDSHPIGGVNVYAFIGAYYTGISGITNSEGNVFLALNEWNHYHFRIDYLEEQYFTYEAIIPGDNSIIETIEHRDVTITFQTIYLTVTTPIGDTPIYLFTENENYLNINSPTNSQGQTVFNLPEKPFKFRGDYLGMQYMSDAKIWTDTSITVQEGQAHVTGPFPFFRRSDNMTIHTHQFSDTGR
jgi:hypothetical protein